MAKNILVVDDLQDVSETLAELLAMLGYSASSAIALEEALTLLRNQQFDAVISDLHMPSGDGMRLRTLMLADERFRDIPFIYMTGKVSAIDQLDEQVLLKPFSADDVLAVLEEVLPTRS